MKIYGAGLYNVVTGTDVTLPGKILDSVTTGLQFAYSHRKISTSYSGSCIRLRRSSDNAESDFGFSGDEIDSSSIASWAGGDDLYVASWYDQAEITSATQTTAADQPTFVLDQGDGFAAGQYTDHRLNVNAYAGTGSIFTLYSVIKRTGTTTNASYFHIENGATRFRAKFYSSVAESFGYVLSNQESLGVSFSDIIQTTFVMAPADGNAFINGSQYLDTKPFTAVNTENQTPIFGGSTTASAFGGDILEMLFYTGNHDDETRRSIELDQMTYYGI